MKSVFTINNLISDAKLALQSGAYFSALSLTFAIISECANIEYPDRWFNDNAEGDEYLQHHFPSHYKNGKYCCKNHDRERFQMWIDDCENDHNCDEAIKPQMKNLNDKIEKSRETPNGIMPILNGELVYQLRCTILHEGSDNIEFQNPQKISDIGNSKVSLQMFALILDKDNPAHIYMDRYGTLSSGQASIDINVKGFIYKYLYIAEMYYERNKDQNFNTITIIDNR